VTDISPQQVRTATFRTTRKGYDPDEVASFLRATAEALEVAQNQSAAMEARARAAVARLQEMSGREAPAAPPSPPRAPGEFTAPPDEAATISRTLLLAQRTADQTVAEARSEAERVLAAARAEAESTIDSTREMSSRLVDDARAEARIATETERRAAEGEVMALLARRDFLVADVDHLEAFLVEQRERIRDAAAELADICDRVPAGLAGVRRPLLSAAADDGAPPRADTGTAAWDDDHGDRDVLIAPIDEGWPSGRSGATEADAVTEADESDEATAADEATMAMPSPYADDSDDPDTVDEAAAVQAVEAVQAGQAVQAVQAVQRVDDAAALDDATPAGAEPALSFDAADLRRLGETRGLD
jgi:DivIVA domain-containing protein